MNLIYNFTGYFDDNKQPILVGDKLKSEWGYEVIVVKDEDGDGRQYEKCRIKRT